MSLKFENTQVLYLVQAMVGSISANFRWVTLKMAEPRHVQLQIVLEKEDVDDREEIEEIILKFEALQDTLINLSVDIMIDDRSVDALHLEGRFVYGRKDSSTEAVK